MDIGLQAVKNILEYFLDLTTGQIAWGCENDDLCTNMRLLYSRVKYFLHAKKSE